MCGGACEPSVDIVFDDYWRRASDRAGAASTCATRPARRRRRRTQPIRASRHVYTTGSTTAAPTDDCVSATWTQRLPHHDPLRAAHPSAVERRPLHRCERRRRHDVDRHGQPINHKCTTLPCPGRRDERRAGAGGRARPDGRPSDDEPDHFNSYRELLFADDGQILNATAQLEDDAFRSDRPGDGHADLRRRSARSRIDERRRRDGLTRFFNEFDGDGGTVDHRGLHVTELSYACCRMARHRRAVLQQPVRRSGELMPRLLRRCSLCWSRSLAASAHRQTTSYTKILIADPFIELHTGPGRGYPVFHVIERGAKSRSSSGAPMVQGAHRARRRRLGAARADDRDAGADRRAARSAEPARENYMSRRWQGGVMAGDFGGAS